MKATRKVLILAGPTAIGKTERSIILAERLNGEIISADSVQIYKRLNIGSSKVNSEEQKRVQHHLIDAVSFKDEFNVFKFNQLTQKALEDIWNRGKIPLIVGGSGFYIRSLLRGVPSTPEIVDDKIEGEIQQQLDYDNKDWEKSLDRLRMLDPIYADTLQKNDYQRLRRALCIIKMTDQPISAHENNGPLLDCDCRCIFLSTDRTLLNRLVDERVEKMVHQGLINEVMQLMKEGFSINYTAGKAIGYRETIEFIKKLQHLDPDDGERMDDVFLKYLSGLQIKSRRYAKRQWTWFRNEPDFIWIDTTHVTDKESILRKVMDLYQCSRDDYEHLLKESKYIPIVGQEVKHHKKWMKDYLSQLILFNDKEKRIKFIQQLFKDECKRNAFFSISS